MSGAVPARSLMSIGEVLASQRHMLLRNAKPWSEADDARMTGAAIECRTEAANHLTRTKPFAEDGGGNSRGAVLVDVLRRAGKFEAADAECQELLGRTSVQGIVRQVLEAQRRFIANRDAAAHTVAEATRSP